MTEIAFIPECNADTALLLFMGIHKNHIQKADNNSKIAKAMQSQARQFGKVLIGLTDKDKANIPEYFGQFEEISSEHNVFYKRKPESNHYIIFLKPAVEVWLMNAAQSVNISIKDYGFPDNIKELKRITTHEGIRANNKFKAFISAIKNANAPGFIFLNDIINLHYNRTGNDI